MRRLDHYWQSLNPTSLSLLPLAGLFALITMLRRLFYRRGWLVSVRLPVPVVVVGNIRVGGSGKSPLVIALALALQARGYRVGILSRGHGGKSKLWPQAVTPDSDPVLVGDEPVMIARQTGCPLWVGPDRVAAARALLASNPCDLLVSDDGMQHYALQRDLEIALIDGERRHGNGLLLPAGPLREPLSRLASVDWCVAKGKARAGEVAMTLVLGDALSLLDPGRSRPLRDFVGRPVHALAGIADPESFFRLLRSEGLTPITHAFDDHHCFVAEEIRFDDAHPVLMTRKDAVKCQGFADEHHWVVPLEAALPENFIDEVERALKTKPTGKSDG